MSDDTILMSNSFDKIHCPGCRNWIMTKLKNASNLITTMSTCMYKKKKNLKKYS